MTKFGELCWVPHGLTASGDTAEERLGDPEARTTVQTVRPGGNKRERNIWRLEQRQNLDGSSGPHGQNSRMTDNAPDVQKRRV